MLFNFQGGGKRSGSLCHDCICGLRGGGGALMADLGDAFEEEWFRAGEMGARPSLSLRSLVRFSTVVVG